MSLDGLGGIWPVRDVVGEGLRVMPSSVRGDVSDAALTAALQPLQRTHDTLGGVALALDPALATSFLLTQAGERVGEPRGGITDDNLYRRIVLGRMAAISGGQRWAGVWACWLALSGADPRDARMTRSAVPGHPAVHLEGLVSSLPDDVWIARARAVLQDAVAVGVEVSGVLYLSDAFTLGPSFTGLGGSLSVRI
jgi:hypothetical protein